MVLKNCDFFNKPLDQCFIKFCDVGGLTLDKILQVPDLLHLFILDDAVHFGLPTLVPKSEYLICNGVVVVFLIDLLQKLLLQLVQTLIYNLRQVGITPKNYRCDVGAQSLQEIVLLTEYSVDGIDHHLLQKCFIDRPTVAGATGSLQAAAAPPDDGLAASVVPMDASIKFTALAAENDLHETALTGITPLFAVVASMDHTPANQLLLNH